MACICDFCSAPNAGWRYPARSFIGYAAFGIAGQSVGDWAACEECHRLIERDARAPLTEKSVSSLIAAHPEMAPIRTELTTEIATLHAQFFDHRMGSAEVIA